MDTDSGRRGSVKQSKNGSWYYVVDTTPAGAIKREQTRRRGFATRRAAQAALTRTLRDLTDRTYVDRRVRCSGITSSPRGCRRSARQSDPAPSTATPATSGST